jgi:hypothetical protein
VEVVDLPGKTGLGEAAVEDGDLVGLLQQPPDDGQADEARAAKDEDLHEASGERRSAPACELFVITSCPWSIIAHRSGCRLPASTTAAIVGMKHLVSMTTEELGKALAEARTARGLSLLDVERDTRISSKYLKALEEARLELLPAPVYARAFMRTYVRA